MWAGHIELRRLVVADVDILTGPGGIDRLIILSGSVVARQQVSMGSITPVDRYRDAINKQTSQSFSL